MNKPYYNLPQHIIDEVKEMEREANELFESDPFFDSVLIKFPSCKCSRKPAAKNTISDEDYTIKDVKFEGPATIVFWTDGTKTVVKARNGEKIDHEKGLAMALVKKACGNTRDYYEIFKNFCPESCK